MSENMVLSVLLIAKDLASPAIAAMSASIASMGALQGTVFGLGTAVVGVGVASAKLASDFETQFARISGLTGSSADQIAYYKQKILELSPSWDMSATAAAKA